MSGGDGALAEGCLFDRSPNQVIEAMPQAQKAVA
jgi:hypothetical protein